MDKRIGGLKSLSGLCEEEKNLFPLPVVESGSSSL
jgi:hypothetical protein